MEQISHTPSISEIAAPGAAYPLACIHFSSASRSTVPDACCAQVPAPPEPSSDQMNSLLSGYRCGVHSWPAMVTGACTWVPKDPLLQRPLVSTHTMTSSAYPESLLSHMSHDHWAMVWLLCGADSA